MNNTDFRRMVLNTSGASSDDSSRTANQSNVTALGSKVRSSIHMTPRTIKGVTSFDFAQQLAARDAASRPQKKFKSAAAPRGTKLAKGYHDRTQDRTEIDEDEKAVRIKALEEQMKLGQMERNTFEKLRDDITGGDIRATHLVKGLDWKLLERVKRGEDVLGAKEQVNAEVDTGDVISASVDEEEELEELEARDIVPLKRKEIEKKGEMAPPPNAAGKKRSRNDILAELKAARQAAQDAAKQLQLGSKFRKIGDKRPTSRIEKDERGREILITVDEYGRVKRKVRRNDVNESHGLLMPDKNAAPLGMEVPDLPSKDVPPPDQDEDGDIFEGVGDSYDPLGAADDSSSDTSGSGHEYDSEILEEKKSPNVPIESSPIPATPSISTAGDITLIEEPKLDSHVSRKHNYFKDATETSHSTFEVGKPFSDPTILAALKRAAAERKAEATNAETDFEASNSAATRLLSAHDRDLDDMDLGFGSSRFGDEEDDDGDISRVRLSEWTGGKDDANDGGARGGTKQRKRGKKKRKGDKNNASDVLGVIEGRRGGN